MNWAYVLAVALIAAGVSSVVELWGWVQEHRGSKRVTKP